MQNELIKLDSQEKNKQFRVLQLISNLLSLESISINEQIIEINKKIFNVRWRQHILSKNFYLKVNLPIRTCTGPILSVENFNTKPELGDLNDVYTYEPTAAKPLHLVNDLTEVLSSDESLNENDLLKAIETEADEAKKTKTNFNSPIMKTAIVASAQNFSSTSVDTNILSFTATHPVNKNKIQPNKFQSASSSVTTRGKVNATYNLNK